MLWDCFTYVHQLADRLVDEDDVGLNLSNLVGKTFNLLLHERLLLADVQDGLRLIKLNKVLLAYLYHDLVEL